MSFRLDARIPVMFAAAEAAGPDDALLLEGPSTPTPLPAAFFDIVPGHTPGCACCAPRRAAGRALAALLQDRARGKVAFFKRVIAVTETPAGRAEVEAALSGDPVAASCFRLVVEP